MKPSRYEFDPKGDAELVLRNRSAELAYHTPEKEEPAALNIFASTPNSPAPSEFSANKDGEVVQEVPVEELDFVDDAYDEPTEIRMRVSSRHLVLASPVFRKMLNGSFKDTRSNTKSLSEIPADWDVEALVIILDIIHGHHRTVPKSLTLEMLAKVATIVDYYACQETVEVFVDRWLAKMDCAPATEYGEESMLWLSVAWVFGREDVFEKMSELAVRFSDGSIDASGLAIPDEILIAIDQRRQDLISQVIDDLDALRETLCNGDSICSPACSSMLLGSLMKQMHKNRLLNPLPMMPFTGYSVHELINNVSGFSTPAWRHEDNDHSCTLADRIPAITEKISGEVKGFELGAFVRANWTGRP